MNRELPLSECEFCANPPHSHTNLLRLFYNQGFLYTIESFAQDVITACDNFIEKLNMTCVSRPPLPSHAYLCVCVCVCVCVCICWAL